MGYNKITGGDIMNQNRSVPADRVLEKLDEYLSKNDYDAAKRHLIYWLSEAKECGDERVILLLNNELMGLCRKLAQKEEALKFANDALLQIKKMGIENNIGAATTYLNSATVYKAFGMAEDAMGLFEKAKEIYERSLSPKDDRLGGLYNNMALALVDLKRFDEADLFYKKAISVMKSGAGYEPEQAITYLNMATAAEMQFGLEGAETLISDNIQKAMELLDLGKNRDDGNYAFVCEKCAGVFGYYGYFDYENQLKERYRRIYERA